MGEESMVEVGIVIKWSTGTLAGKHSFPYIDVVSADEMYISAELGEIIPCLLYTSPSPRDRQKSRMPSSA